MAMTEKQTIKRVDWENMSIEEKSTYFHVPCNSAEKCSRFSKREQSPECASCRRHFIYTNIKNVLNDGKYKDNFQD